MPVLPTGCRGGIGLRGSLRDQELWQLRQLHPGQIHSDPCGDHHLHQRRDVHFRPGGLLRHHPGVQIRPWFCKCVSVCETGGTDCWPSDVLTCGSCSFLLSSFWSSCWSLQRKLLLWCLALSTEERWGTQDANLNTLKVLFVHISQHFILNPVVYYVTFCDIFHLFRYLKTWIIQWTRFSWSMMERVQRAKLLTTCRFRFAVLCILFLPPIAFVFISLFCTFKSRVPQSCVLFLCVWCFKKQTIFF